MVGHKSGHDAALTETVTGNEICIMHLCGGLDQAHINFLQSCVLTCMYVRGHGHFQLK